MGYDCIDWEVEKEIFSGNIREGIGLYFESCNVFIWELVIGEDLGVK